VLGRLRDALRAWLGVDALGAAPPPKSAGRRGVSEEALALASALGAPPPPENPFAALSPAPGVLPEGVRPMAMDEAAPEARLAGWALGQALHEGMSFPGYPYLAELAQRPEYRRMSETMALEMTRKWVTLESTGDDGVDRTEKIEKIEDCWKRLAVQDAFRQAQELDGYFGRGHLFVDLGTGDRPGELESSIGDGLSNITKAKVKKGGLKALRVVEPVWTYPSAYNSQDPLAPDFYRPQSWYVMGRKVHATRLLTFVGREVSDMLKPAYGFGGISLTQLAKPYVDNWLRTRQSVSDMVHSFSVAVLKTNMGAVLQGGAATELLRRVRLFNLLRDNRGAFAIDKDTEEFENVSAPLGGLDALQAQAQEQMAAVSGIPLVKLLGITPSGLNASSDGEMRCFYDWVEAQQEADFRKQLEFVLRVTQLSEFGEVDPAIAFRFNPLWSLDDAAAAGVRQTDAQTAQAYVDMGALLPEEVRQAIADDDDSPYGSLDMSKELQPEGDAGAGLGDPGAPGAPPPGEPDPMQDPSLDDPGAPPGPPGPAGKPTNGAGGPPRLPEETAA